MTRHWTEHHLEAERLLEHARSTIKQADERRVKRLSDVTSGDMTMLRREIRDEWYDAHIAASDLIGLANLHARLAELGSDLGSPKDAGPDDAEI